MADIKKIKIGSTTYNLRDSRVITLTDNGSTTANWVASTDSPTQNLASYSDGQLFLYKIVATGANTTLNIDGLGAKPVYRSGSSRLNTQYPVGSYILLHYSASLNQGCFVVVNDCDVDTDTKTSSGNTSSKIYLIGATSQSSSGQTTYSHDTVYVDTDGHLYCNGKKVSHVGHIHEITTSNTAPQGHTHNVTVSGTTSANNGNAVAAVTGYGSFSGGSGSLTSNTTTNGIKYVEAVTHNAASLTGTKTFNTDAIKDVTLSASTDSTDGPTYVESVTQTAVTLGGTKTFNTNAIKSVTLSESAISTDGPQYIKSISGGSGSLKSYSASSGGSAIADSGRIKYVDSISAGSVSGTGAGSAAPNAHTHDYSKNTYSLTGSNSSHTTKYMKVSTTAADTASVGISGGSGSLVAYDESTGGNAKTTNGNRIPFITSLSKSGYTPAGSVTLTAGTAPSMNFDTKSSSDTPYISALTKSSYTPEGSVSLTAGTPPSMGGATTKYLSASASGTAVDANGTGSAAPSGHTHNVTVSGTTGNNSGSAVAAVTGYPNFFGGSLTGTTTFVTGYSNFKGGSLTGTTTFNTDAIKAIGGTKNYGFNSSTSNVMYAPTVADGVLSWSTTNAATQDAHSGTAASEATVGFTAASLGTASTGTVGFTPASLGTASTSSAAPHTHTHSYGSSTALTTGANSGTAITALTGVKVTAQPTISLTAGTSTTTGSIKYVEAQGTFTAGTTPKSAASFSGTTTTALVTSGATKYMKFSAGTTPKASASFSGTESTAVVTGGTTYHLAHGHTAASLTGTKTFATNGVKAVSLSASTTSTDGPAYVATATNSSIGLSSGTASATTGANSGTAVSTISGVSYITPTATTYYLDHTHTTASGTTRYMKATSAAADTGTVTISGGSITPVTKYMKRTNTAASTGTVGLSDSDASVTTKYLHHTHTVASLGTASTASVAPSGHTHTFSDGATTEANSGTAIAAVTEVAASTD